MLKRLFAIMLVAVFVLNVQSASAETAVQKTYVVAAVDADAIKSPSATQICAKSSVDANNQQSEKPGGSFEVASLKCGLAPLPPLGCKVGACVCDQSGRNCGWTFICN